MPEPTSDEQRRRELIERLGRVDLNSVVTQEGGDYATSDPFTPIPTPPMTRHVLLERLHRLVTPRTYFEIGVLEGASLALSRATTIAVDPSPIIDRPIGCDLRLFELTSDEFFESSDAFAHFDGVPIDLAFIDGMHLSDFSLRDFMNAEKHAAASSVLVLDDVLPRNHLEAYRTRRTTLWAGDVYKVYTALKQYRPDLVVTLLNTAPTGTLLVANLDPANTVLEENYAEIEKELVRPDPQEVPREILTRAVAADPRDLLAWDGWSQLVGLRDSGASRERYAELFGELEQLPRLGSLIADLTEALDGARLRGEALESRLADERERAHRLETARDDERERARRLEAARDDAREQSRKLEESRDRLREHITRVEARMRALEAAQKS